MRTKLIVVFLAGLLAFQWLRDVRGQRGATASDTVLTWLTDAGAATEQARLQKKTLLINFTGSDWCGWCIRLDEEVFSTAAFADYAATNLVLLKVDFPRRTKLSAAQTQQNEKLATRYGIRGFPTLVVVSSQGAEKGRLGYQPGGPKPWIESLDALR